MVRKRSDKFQEEIPNAECDGVRPEFFDERDWTLLQAVAWIWTRDRTLVCKLSPKRETFGSHKSENRVPHKKKSQLIEVPNDPPTMLDVVVFSSYAEVAMKSLPFSCREAAEDDLIRKLRDGSKLRAIGCENGGDERKHIPKTEWVERKIHWGENRHDDPDRAGRWTDIFLEREAILDLWPSEASNDDPYTDRIDSAAPAARASAIPLVSREQWAKDYYAEQERRLVAGEIKNSPNRDVDHAAAKKAFPKITREETRALRKQFAPESFKKGGRRKEI